MMIQKIKTSSLEYYYMLILLRALWNIIALHLSGYRLILFKLHQSTKFFNSNCNKQWRLGDTVEYDLRSSVNKRDLPKWK